MSIELGMSAERLRRILQARRLGQIIAGRYFLDSATVEQLRAEQPKARVVTTGSVAA